MDGVVGHGNECASWQVQVPSHDGVMAGADAGLPNAHWRVHAQGLLPTQLCISVRALQASKDTL